MSVAAASPNMNFIQRNLIPEDSCNVRYLMQQAAYYGSSESVLVAHFVSVSFAVFAVAISAINAASYLLQAPIKILLNVVQLNPLGMISDFFLDIGDLGKSLLFVSLGLTLVVSGFLIPGPIFGYFSPEYYEPLETRLQQQLDLANKKYQDLESKYNELKEKCRDRVEIQLDYERRLEELNQNQKTSTSKFLSCKPSRWLRKSLWDR